MATHTDDARYEAMQELKTEAEYLAHESHEDLELECWLCERAHDENHNPETADIDCPFCEKGWYDQQPQLS